MQTENFQSEGQLIMLEMRLTECVALSVDLRVGISQSASETDVLLIFLTYDIKIILSFIISFIFDSLCPITTISDCQLVFLWWLISDVTSEIRSSDVTLTCCVSCLTPWANRTFSTTKIEQTLDHRY